MQHRVGQTFLGLIDWFSLGIEYATGRKMRSRQIVGWVGVVGAILSFSWKVRRWYLTWGASADELTRSMPCDDWVTDPNLTSTMAISIVRSPEDIWPWIVQIGDSPRAGYYSYTWIERLVGMRIVNARQIIPEFQSVSVGDVLDKNGTMTVLAVEPGRSLVLGPPADFDRARCSWAFSLFPEIGPSTRLVTRLRANWSYRQVLKDTNPLMWPTMLLIEPGAFIMSRKMLKEIKRLAESTEPVEDAGPTQLAQ